MVPNARPSPVANAEAMYGDPRKKYAGAEDQPLQSMRQRPQRLSSKKLANGPRAFNYNRFKMDLLVGIPFVKRWVRHVGVGSSRGFVPWP